MKLVTSPLYQRTSNETREIIRHARTRHYGMQGLCQRRDAARNMGIAGQDADAFPIIQDQGREHPPAGLCWWCARGRGAQPRQRQHQAALSPHH